MNNIDHVLKEIKELLPFAKELRNGTIKLSIYDVEALIREIERLKSSGSLIISPDVLVWTEAQYAVVEKLRAEHTAMKEALEKINNYIPTRDFGRDVHNLITIADDALQSLQCPTE